MIRVAIVEDDESHGRALARLLRASGIETESFATAESYLRQGSSRSFDCLLVDVGLPGISGFELEDRLLEEGSAPPIVFVSALDPSEPAIAERARERAFVRKTQPASELVTAIREAISGAAATP